MKSTLLLFLVLLALFSSPANGAPTAAFDSGWYSAGESAAEVVVTVRRPAGSDQPLRLNFRTVNDSALAGADYTATAGTIQLAAGETSRQIRIPLLGDALIEGDEYFRVVLYEHIASTEPQVAHSPGGQTLAAHPHVPNGLKPTCLSRPEDPPSVSDSCPVLLWNGYTYWAYSDVGNGETMYMVAYDPAGQVVKQWAKPGARYVWKITTDATAKKVTFWGQSDHTIVMPWKELELPPITTGFGDATGQLDINSAAVVEIVDNDRGFFLPTRLEVFEVNRNISIAVSRLGGSNLPAASVEVVTADETARAGSDYPAVKATLHFAAGETQQWVNLPIIDDAEVEGPETFTVTLQNPTGGTPLDPEHSASVRILDDDRGFNLGPFIVGTGTLPVLEDSGSANFYVSRSGANLPAATVELITTDGTAKAGLDYTAVTAVLTFAAGQTEQFVQIPVLNDGLIEGEEFFTVLLRNPVGYPLDPKDTTLTIRIVDNDHGFVVRRPATASVVVRENDSMAYFEVALIGDFNLTEQAAVTVSTEDGTAQAGADYQSTRAPLVFAPGERVKSFVVPILNDTLAEEFETFTVTLSQPVGAPISENQFESRLTVYLQDNEFGYRLGDSGWPNYEFREGSTAKVTVWRDGDFDVSSSVKLSFSSYNDAFLEQGTAEAGVDFPTNSVVLNFGPGEMRKTVTFNLPDDGVIEPVETFFLTKFW